jgi:Fur family transcriptional regulator, ferric uptake regulator
MTAVGSSPFEDDELERAIHSFAERATFDVSDHELVLHGHCGSCRS